MEQIIAASLTNEVSALESTNKELAYNAAAESIVLLKNKGEKLPLKSDCIALFGTGLTRQLRFGTGIEYERHSTGILEGLTDAGFKFANADWLERYKRAEKRYFSSWIRRNTKKHAEKLDAKPCLFKDGVEIREGDINPKKAEDAVYVITRQSSEGNDKKLTECDYCLSAKEIADIKKLSAAYKTFVLVINTGFQINITDIEPLCDGIIYMGQLGMEGGRAFADILCGKLSPCGRLTETWVKKYTDIPFAEDFGSNKKLKNKEIKDELYREGIYVGYRYVDAFNIDPLFPFGYGLSYTRFDTKIVSAAVAGEMICITLRVKNDGWFTGKEVFQLYGSFPNTGFVREHKRLVGYAKTGLLSIGEEETLTLECQAAALASYSQSQNAFIIDRGEYVLHLGADSAHTVPVVVVEFRKTQVASRFGSIFKETPGIRELEPVGMPRNTGIPRNIIKIHDPDIVTLRSDNDPRFFASRDASRKIKELSIEDMSKLCVCDGAALGKKADGVYVPGALCRTSDKLFDKGLANLNFASGSNGIRLVKESALTRRGRVRFVKDNYAVYDRCAVSGIPGVAVRAGKKHQRLYQYVTSFPSCASLACSWNDGLCLKVGEAIGKEMALYNVSYWIGLSLGIKKNPLFARNCEYISEDPVLCGKIASAIIKGVQKNKGCYVCVKDFCCCNADDNRFSSNSVVSERALREIYLKPFEICVREAGVGAVMAAPVRVNGIKITENYDLSVGVLRGEWGFKGLTISGYPNKTEKTDIKKEMSCGYNLFMGGIDKNRKEIASAVTCGELPEDSLRFACSCILSQMLTSNTCRKVKDSKK